VTHGSIDEEPDSGYPRLEQQIKWYDDRSRGSQNWYKRVKLAEFVCTAGVMLAAHYSAWMTTALGAAVFIGEACQQLFQWHHNWITYRSTCEFLRHEKYSYLARSGPYEDMDDAMAKKQLVERVESLISTEHSKWVANQQKASQGTQKKPAGAA